MKYTAGQAAKASGVATSTITNALKVGKISGEKDEHGSWRIDPAELHRVYPPVASKDSASPAIERDAIPGKGGENSGLERLVAALEEQIADLRDDRDHWRAHAERLALRIPSPPPDEPAPTPLPAERPAARPSWRLRLRQWMSG